MAYDYKKDGVRFECSKASGKKTGEKKNVVLAIRDGKGTVHFADEATGAESSLDERAFDKRYKPAPKKAKAEAAKE